MKLQKFNVTYTLEFQGESFASEQVAVTLTEDTVQQLLEALVANIKDLLNAGEETIEITLTKK